MFKIFFNILQMFADIRKPRRDCPYLNRIEYLSRVKNIWMLRGVALMLDFYKKNIYYHLDIFVRQGAEEDFVDKVLT
jgi:hypothetical protein